MTALIISAVCLALNAFFVAAEFALVKTRLSQLEPRARHGDRRAALAVAMLAKLDRYLSVTQVGITVASLGLGWVGEPAIEAFADSVARATTGRPLGGGAHVVIDILALAMLTFLHVLVGELVPKAIAIRHSVATTLRTALPLRIANTIFWPVLWVLEHAQRGTLRILGVETDMTDGALSEEEIVGILTSSAGHSPAATDWRRTLERVVRFANRPVRQIMVPRVDIVAISIGCSAEEAYAALKNHEFSRVILFGASIDDVRGYLYAKDFLFDAKARSRRDLHGLERETFFVPEMRDGLDVLRDMQRRRIPLAVVVDEYGGTSGIVTMEDLVEEVFGELQDELDAEHAKIARTRRDMWDVDPSASIADLRDAGIPIDGDGPIESLGKIVLERLAHIPHVGDVVTLADGVFAEVIAMSQRRIRRLRVHAPPVHAD